MDDQPLLAHLARDLDGSFEALVRAHQGRVYSICLRLLGNAADAEEIAQDTFIRAYRALAGCPPDRIRSLQLRGWLATIAIRRCRSTAARRRAPTVPLDPGHPALPTAPAAETPHLHLAGRESKRRWAALLASLPERYRTALVLRHVDELSYAEIAVVLGRPEGTVKAQIHRGLTLLRAAHEAAEREESIA
jgi:RNA polymerase sigma factor (sigma-70 family)